MPNYRMQEKLASGEALDVSNCPVNGEGNFDITAIWNPDGIDYCDAKKEEWIWSIGQDNNTGKVWASKQMDYYDRPGFNCLWLR